MIVAIGLGSKVSSKCSEEFLICHGTSEVITALQKEMMSYVRRDVQAFVNSHTISIHFLTVMLAMFCIWTGNLIRPHNAAKGAVNEEVIRCFLYDVAKGMEHIPY